MDVPRLYAIADAEAIAPRTLAEAVEIMAGEGVRWIQLRAKELADDDLCRAVEESCAAVTGTPCRLWIDDRADLARLFPVAGVHVGQRDLPAAAARRAVGPDRWLGLSTHDRAQIVAAEVDEAVDLVALGPVFATASKRNPDPVVGLDRLRRWRALTGKPLVAIGGVNASNLRSILDAGADSVAVLGAICRGDIVANSRRLIQSVEGSVWQ